MIPPEARSARDDEAGAAPGFMTFVRIAVAGIAVMFAAGVLAGFAAAVIDHGVKRPLVAALVVALTGAVLFFAGRVVLRGIRTLTTGPAGPRTLKARAALIGAAALGFVLSVLLYAGGETSDLLLASSPIEPWLAIAGIAVWSVATPLLSLYWWRNIDEHEAHAYRSGALAAVTAYAAIAPGWWLAWRGGFAPRPDEMMIFLVIMTVWGAGWAWNRYR